jgi:hypothetical protein
VFYLPQVDTATFLPIVFWSFVIYVGGFLLLNTSSLYSLLSTLKLITKRSSTGSDAAATGRRFVFNTQTSSWTFA